jgi:pyrroline-5-carboxylate reductase
MLGAARYLLETGRAPQDFIQAVASPKGTTAAGLAVLDKSAIRTILGRTIRAAARRSAELSRA